MGRAASHSALAGKRNWLAVKTMPHEAPGPGRRSLCHQSDGRHAILPRTTAAPHMPALCTVPRTPPHEAQGERAAVTCGLSPANRSNASSPVVCAVSYMNDCSPSRMVDTLHMGFLAGGGGSRWHQALGAGERGRRGTFMHGSARASLRLLCAAELRVVSHALCSRVSLCTALHRLRAPGTEPHCVMLPTLPAFPINSFVTGAPALWVEVAHGEAEPRVGGKPTWVAYRFVGAAGLNARATWGGSTSLRVGGTRVSSGAARQNEQR